MTNQYDIKAASAAVREWLEDFREIMIQELKDQGHWDTGKLGNNSRIEIKAQETKIQGLLWLEDYYVFIENPMAPGKQLYTRGSGASSSQIVQALMQWFRRKGAPNPMRATFATLNTWRKEGRPTRRSLQYSSNGRRTGFLKETVRQFSLDAVKNVEQIFSESIDGHYRLLFRSLDYFTLK